MGYQPYLGKRDIQARKGQIILVQENFTSALHIFGGHVAMIDEIAYNGATSEWIRQGAPREELNNWKAAEILEVFQIKKQFTVFFKNLCSVQGIMELL